ncbi:MAG: DISARM system phospholipase D-like protein DrmC [Acidobacteriia bacterium]|nr:DISARM system phospholipase D-like protein DrmC [Terriglobia bacterium]
MKDPLLSLAPTELNALAASIRSGRVTLPCSAHSLQRVVGTADGDSISRRLEALASVGMSPEAMSACLELLAQSAASRPLLEDLVDLVTTGPEAGGVANRSTSVVVADLFRSAQRSVLVAGYAIYQGQKIFQSLAERMERCPDLHVRMFLDVPRARGDTSSISNQIARFVQTFRTSQWPNWAPMPQVYCCEEIMETEHGKPGSLHAKCIAVDDQQLFVSSANFTEAAQDRNIEVGLLVRSAVLSERLTRFFEALVDSHHFHRAI